MCYNDIITSWEERYEYLFCKINYKYHKAAESKARRSHHYIKGRHDKKFIAFAIEKRLGNYHLQLTPADEPCTLYSSKLGGTPYMPKNFDYPANSGNKPLRLLCQLNFEKLPPMKPFPEKGICRYICTMTESLIWQIVRPHLSRIISG